MIYKKVHLVEKMFTRFEIVLTHMIQGNMHRFDMCCNRTTVTPFITFRNNCYERGVTIFSSTEPWLHIWMSLHYSPV
jgi:hypothetical protein